MEERADKENILTSLVYWERNIFKRILFIFILALVLVVGIVYLSNESIKNLETNTQDVIHTQNVIFEFDELLSILKDAEAGQRGFLLTRDSLFLIPYTKAVKLLYPQLEELKTMEAGNEMQMKDLRLLDSLIRKKNLLMYSNIISEDLDMKMLEDGRVTMDSIRSLILLLKTSELGLMKDRNLQLKDSRTQTKITIGIFSFMALALVIIPLITTLFELRKRLELQQLLDSVLNSSLSGIQSFQSIHDLNGQIIDFKIIQANAASYRLIGSRENSLIGKTFFEVYKDEGSRHLFEQYVNVVETAAPLDIEITGNVNGAERWFYITAVKLRDGVTVMFQDITLAKQSEIGLEKSVVALKQSNLELEQFAYVASHDLQEPLRKILSFSDRLKAKTNNLLPEDSKMYVERIVNAAHRMRILINDLLTYSRAGNFPGELSRVDLNILIKEILADFEDVIQQKNAIVTVMQLPVIEGMKIHFQQLFQNLISNSLKFTDPLKQPQLRIKAEYSNDIAGNMKVPERQIGTYCRIFFIDNGIGFDEQYAENIFKIFQRLHGRSEYEGTGIGLAICKKIVENYKGTIAAHATEGQGSTFIVTLPVKQAERVAAERANVAEMR
jgi:signal transduction histidine kinase/CHASE3 domain sensor protein